MTENNKHNRIRLVRAYRRAAVVLCTILLMASVCSCADRVSQADLPIVSGYPVTTASSEAVPDPTAEIQPDPETTVPVQISDLPAKYVFVFIGDGMGPNIAAAAQDFGESVATDRETTEIFRDFESIGLMTTCNIAGAVTDSAASGTAMFSGHKTTNKTINIDAESGESYITMAQRLSDNGYDVGVITTTPINHATPAAMYANVSDRYEYDEIAKQGIECGYIDFWGGGGFRGEQTDILSEAEQAGFEIYNGGDELFSIGSGDAPVIAMCPSSESDPYMPLELDRIYSTDAIKPSLADVVSAAVKRLGDQDSFFIMTEAGQIDTALSQKDAAAAVYDVLALEDAVGVAVSFMKEHPDETLIIVAADHETGGVLLESGDIQNILHQSTSYELILDYMTPLYEQQAESDAAITAVADLGFDVDSLDIDALRDAYRSSREGEKTADSLDPFSSFLCSSACEDSGINVTTSSHTGGPVAVYAEGCGSELFSGCFDNTELFEKLLAAMNINESID